MKRSNVYRLIEGEREYQSFDPHQYGQDDALRSVADWVVFIEAHVAKAKHCIYELDEKKACEEIRKVAALAVACMEHHETAPRLTDEGGATNGEG